MEVTSFLKMNKTELANKKYYLEYLRTNFKEEITQEYDVIDIDLADIENRSQRAGSVVDQARWLAAFCVLQRLRSWKMRTG